ncbi:MAG: hemerythrin domain-containing protein [Myxococcota bacterium]|nr:hemerythrin domain-containing protein [Myxococcota bacterium]
MHAIDLLIKSHRSLEQQLSALKEADSLAKSDFNKMADELAAHITIEEELFYPAVNAGRTEDILLESLEEHLSLKRVLADLLAIPTDDEKFGPKMHVLAEQAVHHHKEEEEELFPKAKKVLSSEKLEALGQQMEARMKSLREDAARTRIPAQTDDSVSLA